MIAHSLSLDFSWDQVQGFGFGPQVGLALEHFLTQALHLSTQVTFVT